MRWSWLTVSGVVRVSLPRCTHHHRNHWLTRWPASTLLVRLVTTGSSSADKALSCLRARGRVIESLVVHNSQEMDKSVGPHQGASTIRLASRNLMGTSRCLVPVDPSSCGTSSSDAIFEAQTFEDHRTARFGSLGGNEIQRLFHCSFMRWFIRPSPDSRSRDKFEKGRMCFCW